MHLNLYLIEDFSPPLSQTGGLCPPAPLPQHGGAAAGSDRGPVPRRGCSSGAESPFPGPRCPSCCHRWIHPQRHPRGCGQGKGTAVLLGFPPVRVTTNRPAPPPGSGTASIGTALPGHPRAPHQGIPEPRAALQRTQSAAGPPAQPRRLPGAAPSPGPPAAFTCGESESAGRAPLRGGSRAGARCRAAAPGTGPNSRHSGRGHCAGGPGWRARSGAEPRIPRGTRPGQPGGRRGEAGAGPAPRPVPCPGSAAAATASEGRARRARRQLPPPPRGHRRAARRGSRSAPSSRPPRAAAALSRRQPPRVGGGFSLPPFPLSAHSSGSFLLPRSLPPLQPEPFPGRRCRALPIAAEPLPPPGPQGCGAGSSHRARGSPMSPRRGPGALSSTGEEQEGSRGSLAPGAACSGERDSSSRCHCRAAGEQPRAAPGRVLR